MYFLPVSLFLISIWDNFGATTADSSCMNWILMLYIFKRKASVQRSKTHFPLPDKPQGLFVCFTGPLEHIGKWKQRSVLSLPWLFFHKTTISYWSVLNDKHKCLGKTQFLLTFSNYFYMAAEILWVGKINTSLVLILLFSFFFLNWILFVFYQLIYDSQIFPSFDTIKELGCQVVSHSCLICKLSRHVSRTKILP